MANIIATYRTPRRVFRQILAGGLREDRALAMVMGACLMLFLGQWPALARAAYLQPEVPLEARLGGALLASVFLLPLILYALAGISHVLARAFGGRGSFFGARIALFWALVATAPLALLLGLVSGFFGQGAAIQLAGLAVFAAFLVFWVAGLRVAEFEEAEGHAEIPG